MKMRALKCERSVSQIVFVRMTMRSREDKMLWMRHASDIFAALNWEIGHIPDRSRLCVFRDDTRAYR